MSEQFKMTLEAWEAAQRTYGDRLPSILSKYGNRIKSLSPSSDGQVVAWIGHLGEVHHGVFYPEVGDCWPYHYFILRPRKKVTVVDYVFKATGETRVPLGGEWILFERSGDLSYVEPNVNLQDEYPIYTREAVTREIEVDE